MCPLILTSATALRHTVIVVPIVSGHVFLLKLHFFSQLVPLQLFVLFTCFDHKLNSQFSNNNKWSGFLSGKGMRDREEKPRTLHGPEKAARQTIGNDAEKWVISSG